MVRGKKGRRGYRKPLSFSQSIKRYGFWKAFTYRIKKRPQIILGIFLIILGMIIFNIPLSIIGMEQLFNRLFIGIALVFVGFVIIWTRFEMWIRR